MANCTQILHNIPNQIEQFNLSTGAVLSSTDLAKLCVQNAECIPVGTVFGPFAVRKALLSDRDELKFTVNDQNGKAHSFCPLKRESLVLKQILAAQSKTVPNCQMVLEDDDKCFVKIIRPVQSLPDLAATFISPETTVERNKMLTSKIQADFDDTVLAQINRNLFAKKFVCSRCTLGFTNPDTLKRHQNFYCTKNEYELSRFNSTVSNQLPKTNGLELEAISFETSGKSDAVRILPQNSTSGNPQERWSSGEMKSVAADAASTSKATAALPEQQLYRAALLAHHEAFADALLAGGGAMALPVACHDDNDKPFLVSMVGSPQIVIPVAVHRSRFSQPTMATVQQEEQWHKILTDRCSSSSSQLNKNDNQQQQNLALPSSHSQYLTTIPLSTTTTANNLLVHSNNAYSNAAKNEVNMTSSEYGIQESENPKNLSQLFRQFCYSSPSTSTSTPTVIGGHGDSNEETPLDLSTRKRKSSEKTENVLLGSHCCGCGQMRKPVKSENDIIAFADEHESELSQNLKDFDNFCMISPKPAVQTSTVARKRRKCASLNTPTATTTNTVEKRLINSQPPFNILSQKPFSLSLQSPSITSIVKDVENKEALIDIIKVDDKTAVKEKVVTGIRELAADCGLNVICSNGSPQREQQQNDEEPQQKQRIICDCGVSFLVQETYNGHKKYYCKNRVADNLLCAEKQNNCNNNTGTVLKGKTSPQRDASPNPEPMMNTVIKRARPVCCELCAFRPSSQAHLARHLRASHAPHMKCFICKLCGYKGYSERGIKNHLRTTHDAFFNASSATDRKIKGQASAEYSNYGNLMDFVRCVSSYNTKIC